MAILIALKSREAYFCNHDLLNGCRFCPIIETHIEDHDGLATIFMKFQCAWYFDYWCFF